MKINKKNLQKLITEELTSILSEQAMEQARGEAEQARGEAEQAAKELPKKRSPYSPGYRQYIGMNNLRRLSGRLDELFASQIEGNTAELDKAVFTAGSLIELLHGVVEFITLYKNATRPEQIEREHRRRLDKLHAAVDGRDPRTGKRDNSALAQVIDTNLYGISN